jgi:hypothetical protein
VHCGNVAIDLKKKQKKKLWKLCWRGLYYREKNGKIVLLFSKSFIMIIIVIFKLYNSQTIFHQKFFTCRHYGLAQWSVFLDQNHVLFGGNNLYIWTNYGVLYVFVKIINQIFIAEKTVRLAFSYPFFNNKYCILLLNLRSENVTLKEVVQVSSSNNNSIATVFWKMCTSFNLFLYSYLAKSPFVL